MATSRQIIAQHDRLRGAVGDLKALTDRKNAALPSACRLTDTFVPVTLATKPLPDQANLTFARLLASTRPSQRTPIAAARPWSIPSPRLGSSMPPAAGCGAVRELLLHATSSEIAATDRLRCTVRFIVTVIIRSASLTAPRASLNSPRLAGRGRASAMASPEGAIGTILTSGTEH
jgi:hypothetical protein